MSRRVGYRNPFPSPSLPTHYISSHSWERLGSVACVAKSIPFYYSSRFALDVHVLSLDFRYANICCYNDWRNTYIGDRISRNIIQLSNVGISGYRYIEIHICFDGLILSFNTTNFIYKHGERIIIIIIICCRYRCGGCCQYCILFGWSVCCWI